MRLSSKINDCENGNYSEFFCLNVFKSFYLELLFQPTKLWRIFIFLRGIFTVKVKHLFWKAEANLNISVCLIIVSTNSRQVSFLFRISLLNYILVPRTKSKSIFDLILSVYSSVHLSFHFTRLTPLNICENDIRYWGLPPLIAY